MGEYKQDMPPSCGYAPVMYKRIPLKPGVPPRVKLLLFAIGTGLSFAWFRNSKWKVTAKRLEEWSAHNALMPMVLAETDRMLLKQMKRNRDIEEKIMKDVEGWEVGKWEHMPVYSSFGPDGFFRPSVMEYFMHEDEKEMDKYLHVFQYN